MKITKSKWNWFKTLKLGIGKHENKSDGSCIMEAVSFLAGEQWTDRPQCASSVDAAFLRAFNDKCDVKTRQRLKHYALRLIGSKEKTEAEIIDKGFKYADFAVRVIAPLALDNQYPKEAARLRALPQIIDQGTATAAYYAAN